MPRPTPVKYEFKIYLNHGIPGAPLVPVRACDLNNPVFEEAARETNTPEGEAKRKALVMQLATDTQRRSQQLH